MRGELDAEKAVIGFCGGPFTVAGYLVEGKPSRDFARTKTLMYREPAVWHALMDRLAEQSARYVAAKVHAGADVIQLFDSWVGALSPADYEEFVEPYSARILAAVDVPTIHFGTGATRGAARSADARRRRRDRARLAHAARRGWERSVTSEACRETSIPPLLLGPWERVEATRARRARPRGRARRPHLQPRPRRPAADRPGGR